MTYDPSQTSVFLGQTASPVTTVSVNFTRPADTNAYSIGDLVANSTTAGSVVPLSWLAGRVPNAAFSVRRGRIKKSNTGLTNAQFRIHLYTSSPTIANGDNGAWSTTEAGYHGYIAITIGEAFSDSAVDHGAPAVGQEINFSGAQQTIYGLIEARAAYTPASAEVFTVDLELWQC